MKVISESSLTGRPVTERAALVQSHSSLSYTEEAANDSQSPDSNNLHARSSSPLQEEELDFTDESILSQFHEDAIRQAGLGSYQWLAMVTTGLALSADSIELFSLPYLLPNIHVDLCSRADEKNWACEVTFLGMVFGSLLWGNLGDQMGRKCILISALTVNFLFNTIAAFMPTYKSFITARFCSAIGVGGIYPLAIIYFSEFFPRASRAKYVCWHLIFWLAGGCYVVLLAHIFLPETGMDMIIESRQHVGAWRQFLLLCAVPSIPAIIKLVFLAESPRFLLESGRDVEAMVVYQCWNNLFFQLFMPPHLRVTILLLIFWFLSGFSYYGLTIWFPEKTQLILIDDNNENAVNTSLAVYDSITFDKSLENRHWTNSIFVDCNFSNLLFSHVTFDNCTFERVVFTNITSIGTFFMKSSFTNSRFLDTDITRENFMDCFLFNTSIHSNRKFCKNGFNTNIDLSIIFRENQLRLIGDIAIIVMTGLFIGQTSRTRIIGLALLYTSVGCFAIWITEALLPLVMYSPLILCAFIMAWACANIAVIESYPTHLRSSGFCLMMAVFRIAGLFGVTVYHYLATLPVSVTVFSTIAIFLTAAVSALKLPNSQNTLL